MTNPDPYSEVQDETQDLAIRFTHVFEETFRLLSKQRPPHFNPIFQELNGNQFRTLQLLHQSPGMVQKALADQLGITPAAISTGVRHMERCGLLQRKPDTQDARLMRLYLSDEAQKTIQEMQTHRWRAVATLLEGLPLPDQRMVVEALERALAARQQAEDQTNHIV